MAENLIDLTPKGILNYMRRIEGAIQREGLELYVSPCNDIPLIVQNENLIEEAKSMLDFVGLNGFLIDIKFDKTADGVAGLINSPNNTTEKAVHISISEKFKTRWKCCIAILAHEICHKVLAVNGLYENETDINETLVDLSTIYVGFGNLILDGYVSEPGKQIIGYLNLNNYKVAQQIISVVYGKVNYSSTGLKDVDFLIDNVLSVWQNAKSEYGLMKDCFVENEKQISEFHRNIRFLEQIILQCKQDMIHTFSQYDNVIFKNLSEKDGSYRNKLTALGVLYDFMSQDSYPVHKENNYITRLNSIISNCIYDLFQVYQTRNAFDFKYNFECPKCGSKMNNDNKVVDRNTILRCSKCGCHYYHFGETWNFTKRQREIKDVKLAEKARIEDLVKQRVDEYKQEADKLIAAAQLEVEKANKDLDDALLFCKGEVIKVREIERSTYRRKVLEKVPLALRWLFEKYL